MQVANGLLVGDPFVFETKLKPPLCNAQAVWRPFASPWPSLQPGRSLTGPSWDAGWVEKSVRVLALVLRSG